MTETGVIEGKGTCPYCRIRVAPADPDAVELEEGRGWAHGRCVRQAKKDQANGPQEGLPLAVGQ